MPIPNIEIQVDLAEIPGTLIAKFDHETITVYYGETNQGVSYCHLSCFDEQRVWWQNYMAGTRSVNKLFDLIRWWLARTIAVQPEWLRMVHIPAGAVSGTVRTTHGGISRTIEWLRANGYRYIASDFRPLPLEPSATSVTTSATDQTIASLSRDTGDIIPWDELDVHTECVVCDYSSIHLQETTEPDGINGMRFVADFWYSDNLEHLTNVYLCESDYDNTVPCDQPNCDVRTQYMDGELRIGRRTFRGFCSIEIHDNFLYCELCETYLTDDGMYWNDHMERCSFCAEETDPHEDCEECGTSFQGHDDYCDCAYCDQGLDNDEGLDHCTCDHCEDQHTVNMQMADYRDRMQAQRRLNSYSFKPYTHYFPSGEEIDNKNRRLHIGLEIEVSFGPDYYEALKNWVPKYETITDGIIRDNWRLRYGDEYVPNFIFCKSDSSVSNGFEIVTMPFEPEWGIDGFPWEEAFRDLIDNFGAKPEHKSTGQHIHMNKSAFDMAHFWKFFQFHQKLSEFCGMIGGRGTRADYGTFHNSSWKSMKPVLKELAISKGEFKREKMYSWYPERYSAINTDPPTTIELRYPSGSIEPAHIRKNIQWAWSVFEYTDYIDIVDVHDGALDTANNYLWWIKRTPERFADLITYIETIIPQPKPLRERG